MAANLIKEEIQEKHCRCPNDDYDAIVQVVLLKVKVNKFVHGDRERERQTERAKKKEKSNQGRRNEISLKFR